MLNETLSYINGDNAELQAPDDLITMAKDYLKENPLIGDVRGLSPEQGIAYSFLHNEFIKSTPIIDNHICWHSQFGSGGTQGEGSGEEFISFHRNMIKDLATFIDQPISSIPITDLFTAELADLFPTPKGVSLTPDFSRGITTPTYLTAEGGNDIFTLSTPAKEIKSLNDMDSIDELGRVLGESGYHGSGHGLFGGTMLSFESPRSAIFYSWHGHLDNLAERFLETEKGQSWLQSEDSNRWKEDRASASEKQFSAICPPNTSPPSNEKRINGALIGGTVGGSALLLGMAALYICKKKMFSKSTQPEQSSGEELDIENNGNIAPKVEQKNEKNQNNANSIAERVVSSFVDSVEKKGNLADSVPRKNLKNIIKIDEQSDTERTL